MIDVVDFKYVLTYVFTAIFGVFGIYHLASYLVLRHKILLYYFILILGLTLHWGLSLLIKNSLGTEVALAADKASLITAMITTYGLLMFTKNYLNIVKSDYPSLSRIYTIVTLIVVCLPIAYILNILTMEIGWINDFLVMLAASTAMTSIFLNIFSGVRLYNANKFNRFYLFSYAPMLLAAILYVGTWFLKKYFEFDASAIILISSILVTIQLILFSVLVGYKFKSIEDDNIEIQVETNKKLKREVDRQTKNLQIAMMAVENQNEQLQSVNRLKNKLFSLITHDVRGPLNNVTTIIELIEDDLADNELKQIAKKLKNEIYDRVSMVNVLLEWSYKQLEGVTMNKEVCDLEDLFNSIGKEFERMAEEKNITIEHHISCPTLFIDENMLRVILRNLISNAIKFSRKGQKIILSCQRISDTVEVGVKDFGLGMNTEWYKRLEFDGRPEIREGTEGEKGTGFGLMIAKDFVEMNGGEMICESEMNMGTRFILRFTVSPNDYTAQ